MKYLLCLFTALLVGCASTSVKNSGPITVTGRGVTQDEAMRNGFNTAIEIHSGAVVLSDKVSQDQKLVTDTTQNYSAGYIDKYEITNTVNNGKTVIVTMNVWVRPSSMANQKLNPGGSNSDINGHRLNTQFQSVVQEKQKGDALLSKVLSDFPYRAFEVQTGKINYEVGGDKTLTVLIPYMVRWDQSFLKSLEEATSLFGSAERIGHHGIHIIARPPGNWFDRITTFYFADYTKFSMIKNSLNTNRARLRIKIIDIHNKVIYKSCTNPFDGFTNIDDHFIDIKGGGGHYYKSTLQVEVPNNIRVDLFNRVEVSVDSLENCMYK